LDPLGFFPDPFRDCHWLIGPPPCEFCEKLPAAGSVLIPLSAFSRELCEAALSLVPKPALCPDAVCSLAKYFPRLFLLEWLPPFFPLNLIASTSRRPVFFSEFLFCGSSSCGME